MKKILFFSGNKEKIKEVRRLFEKINFEVVSLNNFDSIAEPNENGKSFSENAKIKSLYGFQKMKIPCFADDSGICIEALNYKPNILSKRFINKFKSRKECLNFIIDKVSLTKKKRAYFKSSICYTLNTNYHIVFEGTVHGTISRKILGKNGFGYDPIFVPNGYSKTFAEITMKEKNYLSHRSVAINKFINFLSN